MSEKKNKEKRKENLLTFDTSVEDAEDIIAADKDIERRTAFQEAYKRIAKIIPEYFLAQRKKRKNGATGGTAFSQNIVVAPDKVTLQTKETEESSKEEENNAQAMEEQKERE